MPLSLDQYSDYLETRDIIWPAPPTPIPVKARPHLQRLPEVRCILWTVYGTLLNISESDLKFWADNELMVNIALDKTITEYKMWQSMSRKPGQPAEYMRELYRKAYDEQRLLPSPNEKLPETRAERVWESLIKKLFLKEYKFDAGFFGSLNEYSRKVAYFFHSSMQGTAGYPGAASILQQFAGSSLVQGVFSDGQCFTMTQLRRGLKQQEPSIDLDHLLPESYRFLSCDLRGRKPSRNVFTQVRQTLAERKIEPHEVLHVGSNLIRDIRPAKEIGFRTALFAGDKNSLVATAEQINDSEFKPDLLITDLSQLTDALN